MIPRVTRHAPAGRRIANGVFERDSRAPGIHPWCSVPAKYFDSGTSALAVAIGEARAAHPRRDAPVWLPAYACPNLVSAARYVGAAHDFLDFAEGGSAPPVRNVLETLDHAVAVAVDFCGIPSFAPESRGDADSGSALVHDLAQSYRPFVPGWSPVSRRNVVSFGRAKPVSLTLGGALLGDTADAGHPVSQVGFADIRLRSRIYNLSLDRRAFGVLARLPFLGIGVTRVETLSGVRALDGDFAALVSSAVGVFRKELANTIEGTRRALSFATQAGLALPFDPASLPADLPLWRMPVLFDEPEQASRFAHAAVGFGVSRLYQKTLPEYFGVDSQVARERWPNAWRLSRLLVTLPTHGRLTERDWQRLERFVGEVRGSRK
jgi:hypothetical protein